MHCFSSNIVARVGGVSEWSFSRDAALYRQGLCSFERSLHTLGLEAFEEVVGLAFDWLTEKPKRGKVGTLASLSQTGGSYEDRAAPETPYSPVRPSISDFSSTSAYVTPSPARQERSLKRE